ncbi:MULTISPECIES: sugar ABC transporter permease [unclassified Mesorhizobium]|uniref:carbohydrate ABC transporter permease n=1 Tax=unclassified Mesorhizobium TaxID=325217 RepID=UPI000FE7A96D|nr:MULTISPECIES: sugar ABC transporter permease [unclassified Mesorhizobium]RWP13749.1 MAG: sugar ABC transporter permease [Mesorhizobium sp.]RWQ49911.1 MAG: sugar ABC transporter permease [Mesorhizobium sp.]BCH14405.1 ABC transporter permease [Mesorhizobium sp. L-2-11]
MSAIAPERTGATTDRTGVTTQAIEGSQTIRLAPNYWPFVVPALVVVSAVIVFPWAFTLWMSVNRWTLGQSRSFAGMENYLRLASDPRFWESLVHTLTYTSLSVAAPMLLGTVAALIFDARFPLRGLLRGVFVMPMMATPVAVALVWTMMFHPQLGVLNYLLSLVGIPAQEWIFNANTVIPSLVAVETWQWTPLVMLIVLGGLASVPREPFESAEIDGANAWQQFRYLTLPMIAPFLMIALIIRTIDALKSFDIIYAMTQGGPGTASETINIYLYNTAFSYYDIGYGSAMAVVFFIVIVALSFILLMLRQRSQWNDAEGK